MAGLQDILDASTLPVGARIAQVVLAGTAVAYVATRRVNARADLMLVVEMVHGDLTDDVRTGLLPALDPQIVQLERTLTSAQRLAPSAIAAQAASLGHWWEPVPEPPSALTPEQQNRVDGYVSQLDAAAVSYGTATRPWWRFSSSQAPRHFHGNQRPRTLHASATPQRKIKRTSALSPKTKSGRPTRTSPDGWNVTLPELDDGVPATPPRSSIPVPRAFERNLLFDGPVPAITVAISRSRGVDPAQTDQIEPIQAGRHIELGHSGLSDVLHR